MNKYQSLMAKHQSIILAIVAIFTFYALIIVVNDSNTSHNNTSFVTLSEDGQHIGDSITSVDLKIIINGFELELDLSEYNPIVSAYSLSAETQNVFEYTTTDDDIEVYLNYELVNGKTTFIPERLDQEEEVIITIKKNNDQRNITLQTLPDQFPTLQFTGASISVGDFYGDVFTGSYSYVYKFSNIGELLYYGGGYHNDRGTVMNLEKHDIDGEIYYSFFKPNTDTSTQLLFSGITYGEIILMDDQYQLLDTLTLFPTESNPSGGYVENHEFVMIDENHYILVGAIDENVYMSNINEFARVKAVYIQEVKDGEVLFEWNSTDYPEFYSTAVENNDYTNTNGEYYAADYMHFNSLIVDPRDNNFIVSLRNQDSIIKIERTTGDVLWTLGGLGDDFNLTSEQSFSRQHYASVTDEGNILLYDNGNANNQSRVIELTLDEVNKAVLNFEEFVDHRQFSFATGAVVKTDIGSYVIGWGIGSQHSIMSEINPDTNEVYCELIPEANVYAYRVVKA